MKRRIAAGMCGFLGFNILVAGVQHLLGFGFWHSFGLDCLFIAAIVVIGRLIFYAIDGQ